MHRGKWKIAPNFLNNLLGSLQISLFAAIVLEFVTATLHIQAFNHEIKSLDFSDLPLHADH